MKNADLAVVRVYLGGGREERGYRFCKETDESHLHREYSLLRSPKIGFGVEAEAFLRVTAFEGSEQDCRWIGRVSAWSGPAGNSEGIKKKEERAET